MCGKRKFLKILCLNEIMIDVHQYNKFTSHLKALNVKIFFNIGIKKHVFPKVISVLLENK